MKMYDLIARYYELTHAELKADIRYILGLAERAKGPVLELGCGSGRILLPLARAGHIVTGMDNSPAMLALARERLAAEPKSVQQRVTLLEADMAEYRLPDTENRYALALIPYNTFLHLEPDRKSAALRCIRACLRKEGQLFIDLMNPMLLDRTINESALTLENCLLDPETGEVVLHMSSSRLDEAAQILNATWIYDVTPAEGGSIQRTVAQGTYHYLYPHQIELILTEAGFKLDSLAGDYDGGALREDSDRLLILAGRR